MNKLVVANWKMNPQTYEEADALVGSVLEYGDKNVVLCPPYPWLTDFSHTHYKKVGWGAQDVSYEKEGAYTGEVSAGMLRDAQVEYVLVGHSERRALGDTDEIVGKKLEAALGADLQPVLCVGETARNQENNKAKKQEKDFVKRQLEDAFKEVRFDLRAKTHDYDAVGIIIAYEPVWAISSNSGGVADTPDNAEEMIQFIKDELGESRSKNQEVRVLYGGSVNAENVGGFLERDVIDGVLVGSASLDAEEFKKIVDIAQNC